MHSVLKVREANAVPQSLREDLDLEAYSLCWVKSNFILPRFGEANMKPPAIKPVPNVACLFHLTKFSLKIIYCTTNSEVYSQSVNSKKGTGQC